MSHEFINFEEISRRNWQGLHQAEQAPLTQAELDSIKSLNDKIDIQDVRDVYLPLISLVQIYKNAQENLSFAKGIFLQKQAKKGLLSLAFQVLLLSENQPRADSCNCF